MVEELFMLGLSFPNLGLKDMGKMGEVDRGKETK